MIQPIILKKLEKDYPNNSFNIKFTEEKNILLIDNKETSISFSIIEDIPNISLKTQVDIVLYDTLKEKINKYFKNKGEILNV